MVFKPLDQVNLPEFTSKREREEGEEGTPDPKNLKQEEHKVCQEEAKVPDRPQEDKEEEMSELAEDDKLLGQTKPCAEWLESLLESETEGSSFKHDWCCRVSW